MSDWRFLRWGAVRVAGLDAGLPSRLRLVQTCQVWDAIACIRSQEAELSFRLFPFLHLEIGQPDISAHTRRWLLNVKRSLFNGRAISDSSVPLDIGSELRILLAEHQVLESSKQAMTRDLEITFRREMRQIHGEMKECLAEPNLLNGLLLSSSALADFALASVRSDKANPRLKARRVKSLSAIARFATRAAVRPTPFSTFAAAGILDWQKKSASRPSLQPDAISTRLAVSVSALRTLLTEGDSCDSGSRLIGDQHNLEELGSRSPKAAFLATTLARYVSAPPPDRQSILQEIRRVFHVDDSKTAPLYEDVDIDLLDGPAPPCSAREALAVFDPVLRLARSSGTEMPHIQMCQAFMLRYGLNGVCEDVGEFISGLMQQHGFVDKLRVVASPPAWLNSPLRGAADSTEQFCVECPKGWFLDLPVSDAPCDIALFFSLGKNEMVLTGLQSGRSKYLSRFLSPNNPRHVGVLQDIREFFSRESPLPVAIPADLDTNFQIHPPLCAYVFDFGQPGISGVDKLPLGDFTLRFDQETRCLNLHSRTLGCTVEPIHLGFLRDINLPDSLFLLRALSPRLRDETLSERVAIHQSLDMNCMYAGSTPPLFRPRLVVGHLVLERARWIIRADEIPVSEPGEKDIVYIDRLFSWLAAKGLPRQCTIQPLELNMHATPQFLDWASPYVTSVLRHLSRGTSHSPETFLLIREHLPLCEETPMIRNGKPHVAEWVLQASFRKPVREGSR